ncbi:hypothetical protein EBZ80_12525 [bacterium]|nr:hypothetical protein [bacterium]
MAGYYFSKGISLDTILYSLGNTGSAPVSSDIGYPDLTSAFSAKSDNLSTAPSTGYLYNGQDISSIFAGNGYYISASTGFTTTYTTQYTLMTLTDTTQTFTITFPNTKTIYIILVGGGASGISGSSNFISNGGSGGASAMTSFSATPGVSIDIVVGNGGGVSTNGSSGAASVATIGTSVLSCGGGQYSGAVPQSSTVSVSGSLFQNIQKSIGIRVVQAPTRLRPRQHKDRAEQDRGLVFPIYQPSSGSDPRTGAEPPGQVIPVPIQRITNNLQETAEATVRVVPSDSYGSGGGGGKKATTASPGNTNGGVGRQGICYLWFLTIP